MKAATESQREHRPKVPWSEVRRFAGIVSIGGDAVEDCEAIYDDV